MEHTKAPWEILEKWDVTHINGHKHFYISIGNNIPEGKTDGVGTAVCILPKEDDTPENRKMIEANARLIAAAPELKDVLEKILRCLIYVEFKSKLLQDAEKEAANILAKAEGNESCPTQYLFTKH